MRLKRDFHRWSRWYPERWRADNAAMMLSTYLDVADAEGRDRLRPADKIAMAVGGVASRGLAVVPRRVQRDSSSVLVGLLGAYALFTGIVLEWAPWSLAARTHRLHLIQASGADDVHLFGPFVTPFAVVAALAVVSWIACLCASDRVYRASLAVTAVSGLAAATIAHVGVGGFLYDTATPGLFAAGLALFALVTVRPEPRAVAACTGSWIVLFLALPVLFGALPFSSLFSADAYGPSMFFGEVIQPALGYSVGLLAAVAAATLALIGRPHLAATVVLSSTPFAALAVIDGWSRRDPDQLALLAAAAAIVVAYVVGRASRRPPMRHHHGVVVE